jgi:hypothetical protein
MIGGCSRSTPRPRHDLLEIVEERYGRRSTIVTSQSPVERWRDLIGDPIPAFAGTGSMPTPSLTASCITPTASISPAKASVRPGVP